MIDSFGRGLYQKVVVDPLLPLFSPVSPFVITAIGLVVGVLTLPFLLLKWSFFAVFALILSGFLDTFDGSLARFKKETSDIGAVFDIVSDRVVEFCVVLGLYCYEPEIRGLACLLMLGAILVCVTSFLVVGVFTENDSEKSFYYSAGLVERAEAFLFFALMILFPSWFLLISLIFSGLVFVTAFIRLWQFWCLYKN